jgi:hypothetical protein
MRGTTWLSPNEFLQNLFLFILKFVGWIQVWLQSDKVLDISHKGLRNICVYIAVYETVTRNSKQREGPREQVIYHNVGPHRCYFHIM